MSVTMEPTGNGLIHIPQLHELEPRGKYPPCNCCPYGYHIDLDFVRYCEALSQGNEVSASKQRRRERRRQRHSMEVLLGLTSPSLWSIEQQLPQIPQEESVSPGAIVGDALSQAVEVFEDTLQRSHKSSVTPLESSCQKIDGQDTNSDGLDTSRAIHEDHNKSAENEMSLSLLNLSAQGIIEEQEATPVAFGTMQDFDVASVGSAASGVSTGTLQTIREQMAVSLERMRELEEQVKLIPVLQVQLAVLKEEKRKLLLQQKFEDSDIIKCTKGNNKFQETSMNDLCEITTRSTSPNSQRCSYCLSSRYRRDHNRSNHTDQNYASISNEKSEGIPETETKPLKLTVRDKGVTCSVVTREIGISHQQPKMRNAGTSTHSPREQLGFSEVWKDSINPDPILRLQSSETSHGRKPASELIHYSELYKSSQLPKLNKSTSTSPEILDRKPCSVRNSCINTDLQMNCVFTEDDLDESVAKAVKLHEKYFVARTPEMKEGQTQTINNFRKPLLQIVENLDMGIQVDKSLFHNHKAIQSEHHVLQHGVGIQSEVSQWTRDAAIQMNGAVVRQDAAVQGDLTFQSTAVTQYEPYLWQQDAMVQVEEILKWRIDAGIMAKPRCAEASVEVKPTTRDRGCSDSTVTDTTCDKCNVKRRSVGIGTRNINNSTNLPLDDLMLASSITSNIGVESVGVNHTVSDKKEIERANIGCQVEMVKRSTKMTDTIDLSRKLTHEVAINTFKRQYVDVAVGSSTEYQSHVNGLVNLCTVCSGSKVGGEKVVTPFTSPKMNRHGSSIPIPVSTVSSLHSSNSPSVPLFSSVTVSNSSQLQTVTSSQTSTSCSSATRIITTISQSTDTKNNNTNAANTSEKPSSEQEKRLPSGNTPNTPKTSHRLKRQNTYTKLSDVTEDSNLLASAAGAGGDLNIKRTEPSKEMKAALKVINDYLIKSPNQKELPRHLTNAANIVQQEWFKISGGKTVNPMAVEDYLDYIEGYSSALLEYVVNMTDMSGNTALHYAVSSGNFDVVSILLDSKVCNVNKRNAAGYTCVMLATLVKLRSETHRQIIRRMFHMADVNMKAKPHGQTALMLATSHGSLEMVEMLTEAGADMNIQDADGSTALMCAADHGFVDIVKHIISQPDCDVSITDSDGCSALNIAMESGNRHIGLLLYAHEHFSRGSSPRGSIRHRNSRSSTPTPKCNITPSGRTSASPVPICEQSDNSL
ncbi:KN motif and ankyrin repeat domain-containing protein 2 isoform X2 [Anabrus simplex]|uniref:KN motif and ankyrin repeat domain-containing protein 2 isoform X2 n=1 Tax=Anabrus simplex TaxID=316456 RepID=UPI0035A36483